MASMLKYRNILIGIIISVFLSLLVFFPKNQFRAGFNPGWESAVVAFLQAVIIWMVVQYIIYSKRIKKLHYKIFIAILTGIVVVILVQRSVAFFTDWDLFRLEIGAPQRRIFAFAFFRGIIITSFLFFIAYLLFVTKESERLKRDAEIIKQENLEARLFALQQQINPHFLFNALNTLHSIAPDKETKKYVLSFSNVFRYQLNQNQTLLATLKDELEFTNAYLHILKERFEDGLDIQIHITGEHLNKKTPPVAMQMLIENAVKHNIVSADSPLRITIYTDRDWLVVTNNIQVKSTKDNSTGIGLQNIAERYKLLADKGIIVANESKDFIVKIPLL
ncbi:MAG: histidine kinase [Pseudosphingobacterium sp.]|nr:histidine kinase [Pseudosphingobacterium sp.]